MAQASDVLTELSRTNRAEEGSSLNAVRYRTYRLQVARSWHWLFLLHVLMDSHDGHNSTTPYGILDRISQ